jgi:hypothetical protein
MEDRHSSSTDSSSSLPIGRLDNHASKFYRMASDLGLEQPSARYVGALTFDLQKIIKGTV